MKKTDLNTSHGLNESGAVVPSTNTQVEVTETPAQPVRKKNRRRRLPAW